MTSTLNQLSSVLAELTVKVPQQDVTSALDKAYGTLGKTARLRGFRKGKAPKALIKQMFGEAVRADVAGDLVSTHLQVAFEEHEVVPLSQPDVDAKPLDEKDEFEFTVRFEMRPKLEKLVYDGVEVDTYRVSIDPKQVEDQLTNMRDKSAELIELDEPRPAQKGDSVKIQMKRWEDGEWKETPWPEQEIVLGANRTVPEIEEGLEGIQIDEEKVIDLGSGEEMEEARTRFLVKTISIHTRKLPELDDEFAKDMGDFDTLDALKKDIEEKLLDAAKTEEDQRLKHEMFKGLREKNPFDLPPSLVTRQSGALQYQLASQLAMVGKEPNEEDTKDMADSAKKTAEEMVHQHILLIECARVENLEVSEEEVDASIEEMANERGLPLPMLKAEYNKEGRKDELKHSLLEKKVFEFVKTKVKITETDPPVEDETSDGGEK